MYYKGVDKMTNKLYEKIKKFMKENGKSILIFLSLYLVLSFPLPYYVYAGGGTIDISKRIDIKSSNKKDYKMYFAYVKELKGNTATYLLSKVFKDWELEKEEDVKLYDVVAFKSKQGTTIVHRIIDIQYDDDGHHYYTTRGDSNAISDNGSLYDGYLTFDKLIGHYNDFNIPVLGSFVVFLQSGSGIITIVSIVYCFVMFDIYKRKMDEAIINRSNLLIELIDVKQDDELNITNNFQQDLIYKGIKYTFKDGEFIDKTKIEDQKLIDASVNNMVFINEKENNKTIKVRNTKNKTTKQISNTDDILEKDK